MNKLTCFSQAFGPEKEVHTLLQDVEQHVARSRDRTAAMATADTANRDLAALAPMLLQQADAIERAALAGSAPGTQAVKLGDRPVFLKPHAGCALFADVTMLSSGVRTDEA